MNHHKISVAMATYNGAEFIEEQMLSILNQELPPDEVIICDDASTDNTCDAIRKFINANKLSHWTLIENETNIGCYENFMQALEYTTGDYIFFCDQDDIWLREKTNKMISIMAKNNDISALASDANVIDDKGNTILNKFLLKKHFKNKQDLKSMIPIPFYHVIKTYGFEGMSMVISSDLKKSIICCKDIYSCEISGHDVLTNIISSSIGQLYFYNECLVKYRIHKNNACGIDLINKNDKKRQYDRMKDLSYSCLNFNIILDILSQLEKEGYQIWEYKNYIVSLIDLNSTRLNCIKNKNLVRQISLVANISEFYTFINFLGDISDILCVYKPVKVLLDKYRSYKLLKP